MNKKLKKISSIVLIIALLINIIIPSKVFAAASASLSANTYEVNVGETVTINVIVSGTESYSLKLASSGGVLSGTTSNADAFGEEKSQTVMTASFSSNTAGSYSISLTGTVASSADVENKVKQTVEGKSITIKVNEKVETNPQPPTVTEPGPATNPGTTGETPGPGENTNTVPQDNPVQQEPEKSRNYYLSSLKVNDGQRELDVKQTNNTSAGFNREVEDYTIVFPDEYKFEELTTVRLAATAEDSKAKISGVGEKTVNEGDNTFEISCTAENGSVKTYRVKLTKPVIINKSELKLDSLAIETVKENGDKEVLKLDKDFKNDVYEYTCDLASDIKALNIKLLTSKVKEQDLIVKINGKEISRDLEGKLETEVFNLEDGKNTIRITLVSPTDESVTTDYVITANREAKVVETVEEKKGFSIGTEDLPKIIIGVICGIILLLVIILVVLLVINNKQKKQEKGQTETSDEPKEDDDKDSNDSYLSDKNLERLNKEYAKIDEENSEEAKTTERVETKSDLDKEDKKSEPNEELELLNKNIREMEEVIKLQEDVQNSDNADDIDAEFELESREKDYENTSEESRRQKIDELINEIKNKQKDKKKDDDDK